MNKGTEKVITAVKINQFYHCSFWQNAPHMLTNPLFGSNATYAWAGVQVCVCVCVVCLCVCGGCLCINC